MHHPVLQLSNAEAPRVADVMAEAFHGYPVMRFVLGPADDYERRLRTLVHFFVMARAFRGEPLFGIPAGTTIGAAAIMSYPHRATSPPALAELRATVWRDVGAEARARYDECGRVWAAFAVTAPHLHVNMIGVRRAQRGQGLARRLLDHVHGLSAADPDSVGVTLTTEDPANVPLYEHLGYEVVGHARIAVGVETWGMLRPERRTVPGSATRT